MLRFKLLLILFCALLFQSVSAHAAYNAKKVGDWKYRSYVCKNVIYHVQLLSDLIASSKQALITEGQKLDENAIVDEATKEAERQIILNSVSFEKNYKFDHNDAQLMALLTIAVFRGLQEIERNPDSKTILKSGFDVCVGALDMMDQKLTDSTKN